MSDTSATKKATIVALKEQKLSNRAVAAKENVSASTVLRINAQYGANQQFEIIPARSSIQTFGARCAEGHANAIFWQGQECI
jgi:hypothetical protein